MNDYNEIKGNPENIQNDLDTTGKLEGVYFMPGSPNYVPKPGMKVYMVEIKSVEEVPQPQIVEQNLADRNIMETPIQPLPPRYDERVYEPPTEPAPPKYEEPVYKPPTQPEPPRYEDAAYQPPIEPEPPKYEEPDYQKSTYQEKPQYEQETYQPTSNYKEQAQGTYQPSSTYNQQQNQGGDSGVYKAPTQPSYNYNQQSHSNGDDGGKKSGGGIPKFAIIGAGAIIIALLAFFFLRGKGGSEPSGNNLAGEWTVFAFQQNEDVATFERDDKDGLILIFNDDKTVTFIDEGNEQTGTWTQEGNKISADLGEISSFEGELDGEIFIMNVKSFGQFYFNKVESAISAKEKEISDKSILHGTYSELLGQGEELEEEIVEEIVEEPMETEGPKVSEEKPVTEEPVNKPESKIDTQEDLIGDWEGVVVEMGHYGSKYEDYEMGQSDLIAEINTDNTGKYYFEAYFTDDLEHPVISAYIEFKDDHFTGDIGEEDAWIADHWLYPEENGLLYAKYDDPTTLYIQYDYEDYEEENAGYHLSFYFRKVGESWDDQPFKPESAN